MCPFICWHLTILSSIIVNAKDIKTIKKTKKVLRNKKMPTYN